MRSIANFAVDRAEYRSKTSPFEKGGLRGIFRKMLDYKKELKSNSRQLRNNSTDAEILLWSRLRHKQILNIQFYRQKPIGDYIVDFYAPLGKLVIEVDGEQHLESDQVQKDKRRDLFMEKQGLRVLRFNNLQVLQCIDEVVEVVLSRLENRIYKN
jgi:very-short-patch-repair endonuclease